MAGHTIVTLEDQSRCSLRLLIDEVGELEVGDGSSELDGASGLGGNCRRHDLELDEVLISGWDSRCRLKFVL
jgi:hypothetical protein